MEQKLEKLGPPKLYPAWGTGRIAFLQQTQWHSSLCQNCAGWNYPRWSWPWFCSLPGHSYWTCRKCKHSPTFWKRWPPSSGDAYMWPEVWMGAALDSNSSEEENAMVIIRIRVCWFSSFYNLGIDLLFLYRVTPWELGFCWKVTSDSHIRMSANVLHRNK